MMSVRNVRRYAYLNARVSQMAAQLLSSAEVARTLEARGDQHGDILSSALLDELSVLARAVSGAERAFLLFWAHRFELGNLKAILRGTVARTPRSAIREDLVDLGTLARLPTDELLQADDAAELFRLLEHGPYAEIARQAREVYRERQDLFALDAAVDKRYYAELCELATRIEPSRAPLLPELMAALMARVNVVWLLRYRFAYGLAPMETYCLLVPNRFRLGAPTLRRLVQLGSLKEVTRSLPAPLPAKLERAANAFEVNVLLDQETWRVACDALRVQFAFTRAFAYLLLRERDVQRVRVIVEGKRLDIEPAQVRAALALQEPMPKA
jgi:V/A-type H+-transporting ATPase subunit C